MLESNAAGWPICEGIRVAEPLIDEELKVDLATSLGRAFTVANSKAGVLGINPADSFITITQNFEHGPRWRVNYGPKECVGRRGGDLIIEIDATDYNVKRVLRGQ